MSSTVKPERRLYIGAPVSCAGWEVYHDQAHVNVDHVGAPHTLDPAIAGADGFSVIYSVVLDRLDARTQALGALRAWHRALRPGGVLILVCLDFVSLGSALRGDLGANRDDEARRDGATALDDAVRLTQLAHRDVRSAWTAELLSTYLILAGFANARRAVKLDMFHDLSERAHAGASLSLNVLADRGS